VSRREPPRAGGSAPAIAAVPRQGLTPAWLAPVVVVAALVGGVIAVLLLARRAAAPDVPPETPAFSAPVPARPTIALDVQQSEAGRLTLSDGTRDVVLRPDVRVEILRPIAAADVSDDDWITVIGIPNEVRTFAIRSIVVNAAPRPEDGERLRRSEGGFAGHEASRDLNERPLIAGRVVARDGARLRVDGPAGPVQVDLAARAPLYRLEESTPGAIREGDRLAFDASNTGIASAAYVLVLPAEHADAIQARGAQCA